MYWYPYYLELYKPPLSPYNIGNEYYFGLFTHSYRVDFSTLTLRTGHIQQKGCLVSICYYYALKKVLYFNTNNVESDAAFCYVWSTPRSVTSDQGLHCLPMFLLSDARHKLDKQFSTDLYGKMVAKINAMKKKKKKKTGLKTTKFRHPPNNLDPCIPLFYFILWEEMGKHISGTC